LLACSTLTRTNHSGSMEARYPAYRPDTKASFRTNGRRGLGAFCPESPGVDGRKGKHLTPTPSETPSNTMATATNTFTLTLTGTATTTETQAPTLTQTVIEIMTRSADLDVDDDIDFEDLIIFVEQMRAFMEQNQGETP